MASLILASTSPYRRELLARLGWPFEARAPLFDEEEAKLRASPVPWERAAFLAKGKAQSLAGPGCTVIGGDQLVSFEGKTLGKPGHRDKAVDQLASMAGKFHELLTAVCVIHEGQTREWVHTTRLRMRPLSRSQIENYVDLDRPWDAAGSYKFEKHGIALFESVECDDFSAIQGLPLLQLARVLTDFGYLPFQKGNV
jgi:septum formation protein